MVLGDVMDHPQLYLAYPEIKETPVRKTDAARLGDGAIAALQPDGAVEVAGDASAAELRAALLAVMQELVNRIEGFES